MRAHLVEDHIVHPLCHLPLTEFGLQMERKFGSVRTTSPAERWLDELRLKGNNIGLTEFLMQIIRSQVLGSAVRIVQIREYRGTM